MLDPLTRGRTMLGVGPGSLPTDSAMIGLNPTDTRELLDVNLDIIMRLLRGEVVTEETRTHRLVAARLQLRPYTDPCFDVVEERAAHFGQPTPDRSGWRLVGLMHIAETREQAYKDVEFGIAHWFDYFQHVAAFPQMAVGDSADVKGMIDFINEAGVGAI